MLTFKDYLTESYKNIFLNDTEARDQYGQEVYDLLQKSYAPIGGMKGKGFTSLEDMKQNMPFWKLAIKGGKVVAVIMYKDSHVGGRKRIAIGTDGTIAGKKALADIIKAEYKTNRAVSEVSGPSLKFIMKIFSTAELKQFLVPVEKVKEVMIHDEIVATGKYHYKRQLGNGEWVEKVMIGNPDAPGITQP